MINLDAVATGDRLYCYSGEEAAWPQLALRSMARASASPSSRVRPHQGLRLRHHRRLERSRALPKAGIPYLYLEATNWLLGDQDGYQNTEKDGEVWNSKKDTLSYIEQRYPGRLEQQLGDEFTALAAFLTQYRFPRPVSGAGPQASTPS